MQVMAGRRGDADHVAPEVRASRYRRRRQLARPDQRLRPVDVGEHAFQQLGALGKAAFDRRPFAGADQHRHRAQRPRPLLLLAGQPERHAEIDDLPRHRLGQCRRPTVTERRQPRQHVAPDLRRLRRRAREDVAGRRLPGVAVQPAVEQFAVAILPARDGRVHARGVRRSSVIGNSPGSSSAGISTAPGVWP